MALSLRPCYGVSWPLVLGRERKTLSTWYSSLFFNHRFSDHPEIKTDPPYWAGEKFARKAGSMISNDLLEPTVPNLQFWGVMACLEYGRAAGSR